MNKTKFLLVFITFFLLNCATTPIGTRREPLSSEIIERNVGIKVVNPPSVIAPHFVVKVQEHIRKRHHYNEINTYKKVVLFIPKKFDKAERKFDDDKTFTSRPLKYVTLKVEIKDSPYSMTFTSGSYGKVIIPVDSIIKLCPGKTKIGIVIKLKDEPSAKKELTISPSFISAFKKHEELKRQEEKRLAELKKQEEKRLAKIKKEIEKIINKSWKTKDKVSNWTSWSYDSADSIVQINYEISRRERAACISAGKRYGVSAALRCFKTSTWIQFGQIAPALFKKPYVKILGLTMVVKFEYLGRPAGLLYQLARIVMFRSAAKKIDWIRDPIKKDPEDLGAQVDVDQLSAMFLKDMFDRGDFYEGWE